MRLRLEAVVEAVAAGGLNDFHLADFSQTLCVFLLRAVTLQS